MLSPTATCMTEEEIAAWNAYRQRRTAELKNQGLNQDGINDRQAWFEFIQFKWGLLLNTGDSPLDGIIVASRVNDFGPDLRGIGRYIRFESIKPKTITPKSPKVSQQYPEVNSQKHVPISVQRALDRAAQAHRTQPPIIAQQTTSPSREASSSQTKMPELPAKPAISQKDPILHPKQTTNPTELINTNLMLKYKNAFITKKMEKIGNDSSVIERSKALINASIEWNNMTLEQRKNEISQILAQSGNNNTEND